MTNPEIDESVGTVVGGRFRIQSVLGRGGMATVYTAHDESLGRTVAVKVFRRDLDDPEDIRRQDEEILLLARLNHPALVTLFDAVTDASSGEAYLVMELVDGEDLRSRLKRGRLRPDEAAALGADLAAGLVYIHAKGIVHRDIKPSNILLPEPEPLSNGLHAKLADFGIARIVGGARLTATGMILGTAGYFSPEQALGEAITPASDVYSLGLVLLECLTGERAFPGTPAESMAARISAGPQIPEGLDQRWAFLLREMTSRDPSARPPARRVAAMLTGVEAEAEDEPTRAYPVAESPAVGEPRPTRPVHRARRTRIVGFSLAGALLSVLAFLAVSFAPPGEETPVAPSYPAVEGQLGTHLEQLQRSIEP